MNSSFKGILNSNEIFQRHLLFYFPFLAWIANYLFQIGDCRGFLLFSETSLILTRIFLSLHQWLFYFQVAQSLLWLVAYFWHFTRPALAILLDPDIKSDVASLFRLSNGDYTHVELRGRHQQQHQQQLNQNTVTILLPLSSTATLTPPSSSSSTTKESGVGVDKNDSSVVALLQSCSDETDVCWNFFGGTEKLPQV